MQTEVGREIIQQVLAGYQDIVRRQSVTLTLGGEPIEDTLFATLELKVPPISAKAGREITLSDALKHTPQPDRARNLCELFQASAAQSEEKQKPDGGMELDINGTCMGIDASVNFSRRGVSLQIQKPVTEPLNVVEPMVNRALSFVQSWQAFATRVRNPKEFAVIQPQVTEMIFSAYLLREADRLHIPEQDRIQLIARFEQACEKVGLPDTEPTFAMITYIFREPELREKMNKCSLHDEGYSYSWRDKLDRHTGTSYSSLDGAMAFLRTAVSGARDMGGGNRLNVDPLMPDFQRAIANGGLKEDNVSAAFRAMRLIGRQPDAVRADLITRALMAVGGSDVALYYYLKTHKLAAEVSETDNRVSVRSTNFKGVAQILEEFGKTAAVDAGLDLKEVHLRGIAAHLPEHIQLLQKAAGVFLDDVQKVEYRGIAQQLVRGEPHSPLMFCDLSGSGKTTMVANLATEILEERHQKTEDMKLYYLSMEDGGSAENVEQAMHEFAIDVLSNGGDGKYRLLVIDDLHLIGEGEGKWNRLHGMLNLINPYLRNDPDSAIFLTSEETPETAALTGFWRMQRVTTNTLWKEGLSDDEVRNKITKALSVKAGLVPDAASRVASIIVEATKAEASAAGKPPLPLNFITYGVVIDNIGCIIKEDTISGAVTPAVEAYIKGQIASRAEKIRQQIAKKEEGNMLAQIRQEQLQIASFEQKVGQLEEGTRVLGEQVTLLQQRLEKEEAAREAQQHQLEEMQAALAQAIQRIVALEERISAMGAQSGTAPSTQSGEARPSDQSLKKGVGKYILEE